MKLQHIFLSIVIFILFSYNLNSFEKERIHIDAIVFKDIKSDSSRMDIFIVVPHQTLQFQQTSGVFLSSFNIEVSIKNSAGETVAEDYREHKINTEDYNSAQGFGGEFFKTYRSFNLIKDTYELNILVEDKFSKKTYKKKREISSIDYSKFDLSLSGIMLLSQIEEVSGKYKITPHVSDNVAELGKYFFAFFEIYNRNLKTKKLSYIYRILYDDNIIKESDEKTIELSSERQQAFIKVEIDDDYKSGNYMLQILAFELKEENRVFVAASQRSMQIRATLSHKIMEDIDEAIRKLKYIATNDELKQLKELKTETEKRDKFYEFWKNRDPSPGTLRNEAFDEYYQRVDYADNTFKSYTEGWLTDMGMIFIVLGPPTQVERPSNFSNRIQYEIWIYEDNRRFMFADRNGFGDYRLERPFTFNEKFEYRR